MKSCFIHCSFVQNNDKNKTTAYTVTHSHHIHTMFYGCIGYELMEMSNKIKISRE